MANDERLYFVTYDISSPKRWRKVYKKLLGFGSWLQLSVFQCRLGSVRYAELVSDLDNLINHKEDHVLIVDLGLASKVEPRITSLGKSFQAVQLETIIV